MFRTDDMYGSYPTIQEIKRDYEELYAMVSNLTTIQQLLDWDEKEKFTIEVNGQFMKDFISDGGTDEEIEWIRYEYYGCLSYVYFHIKKGKVTNILFDVWSNEKDDDFLCDTNISEVEQEYNKFFNADGV